MESSNRLTRGLYGTKSEPVSGPFGLTCGQVRDNAVIVAAGWYNKDGERLGWGDLDSSDLMNIACGLQEDEVFLVLRKQHSHQRWASRNPVVDVETPGSEYIAKNCAMFVVPGGAFYVTDTKAGKISHRNGVYPLVKREDITDALSAKKDAA